MQLTVQKRGIRLIATWLSVLLLGLQLFGQVAHNRWHQTHSPAFAGELHFDSVVPECELCPAFAQPVLAPLAPPVALVVPLQFVPLAMPSELPSSLPKVIRHRGPPRGPPSLA